MSFPYSPNLQDVKFESLQTQYDFLNLLRLRHLQWITSADDPEVEDRHSEIARLLEQLTDQYNQLLRARPQQTTSSHPPSEGEGAGYDAEGPKRANTVG